MGDNLCLRCSSSPSPPPPPSSSELVLKRKKRTKMICEHLKEIGKCYQSNSPTSSLFENKMSSCFSQKPPSLLCAICSETSMEGWVCLTCHQILCSRHNLSHVWDHIDQHRSSVSLERKGERGEEVEGEEGEGEEGEREEGERMRESEGEKEEEENLHCCFGHFPSTRIHCFICSIEATTYSTCTSCHTIRVHIEEEGIQKVRSHFYSLEEKEQIPRRHLMKVSWKRQKKTSDRSNGLCGLRNLGNTCYMNSSIQCLSNCQPLSSFFHSELEKYCRNSSHRKSDISMAMGQLFREMWFGDSTRLSPTRLLEQVGKADSMFRSFAQQDAHELLRCVLGALDDELQSSQLFPDYEMVSEGTGTDEPVSPYTSARIPRQSLRRSKEIQPTNGFVNHIKGERNQKGSKQHRSIISELFEGLFESHLVCHRCKNSSFSKETFYDLSLSIPTHERMEEIHTELRKDGVDQPRPARPGFFRRMFMAISVVNAPSVPLLHCLKDFCLTESLAGEQKYRCDKCEDYTEAHRSISFIRLPEILCLHLKRFRFDGYYSSKISTPIIFEEYLDMSPFQKKDQKERKKEKEKVGYRLFGVVTHFGVAGGGHYISFARNPKTGIWYEFNDSVVSEVPLSTVLSSEGYILFYQKIQSQDRSDDIREIKGMVKRSQEEETYYISRLWWQLWKHTSLDIPISNMDTSCTHGFVRKLFLPTSSGESSHFYFPVKSVPSSVWQQLNVLYGGGPSLSSNLIFCKLCKPEDRRKREVIREEKRGKEESQETEFEIVSKKDRKSLRIGESWHLVESAWLQKWIRFSKNSSDLNPGPIPNHKLLDMTGLPHSNLKVSADYRGLVPQVWNYLHQKYGGGPIIARESVNIYSKPAPHSEY